MLCVGSHYVFFRAKLQIRQPELKNAITLKLLKIETQSLELQWDTDESFFVQILEAITCVTPVCEPKIEMPIGNLNSSSLKTYRKLKV